ncbi:MAG: Ku protein, partial [Candidatus Saccharimonadales bacterium]
MITFGMVSIPVKLYTATENHDIAFHQLHDKCDTRIKYQKFCPHCERTIDTDEIEKGYEYARGQYVILDEEDFEQLPLPSKHSIDVSVFVKSEQIDPIYYEKPYYIEPDEAAIRPFTLFMKALTEKQMVGIATITLRNKERLCALRELDGTLLLDTLLYPDEIRVSEE